MREIKFRAWDGEQMVSPDFVDRLGFACWKSNSIPQAVKENVMQYTGLKDKNGVEIYEGDVLLMAHHEKCEVQWQSNRGRWVVTPDKLNALVPNQSGWELSEVIGNIYENPDLLESSK